MDNLDTAFKIINALNAATPGIAQLILLIKRKDGSIGVGAMLDEADEQFTENLKKIYEREKNR